MSHPDPKESQDQGSTKRTGGDAQTKGAEKIDTGKAPPQPSPKEPEKKD